MCILLSLRLTFSYFDVARGVGAVACNLCQSGFFYIIFSHITRCKICIYIHEDILVGDVSCVEEMRILVSLCMYDCNPAVWRLVTKLNYLVSEFII
jgi:hypothetical protein